MDSIDEGGQILRINAEGERYLTEAEYHALMEKEADLFDLVIDGVARTISKRPTAGSAFVRRHLQQGELVVLSRLIVASRSSRSPRSLRALDLKASVKTIRKARLAVEFRSKQGVGVRRQVLAMTKGDTTRENRWSFRPEKGYRWCLLLRADGVGIGNQTIAIDCLNAAYLREKRTVVVFVEIENRIDLDTTIKRFDLDIGSRTFATCDGAYWLPDVPVDAGWLQRFSLRLSGRDARVGALAFEIGDSEATLIPPEGVDATLWAVLIGEEGIGCQIRVQWERKQT